MIKCYLTLCLIANAAVCTAPLELTPQDADAPPMASPLQCGHAGAASFANARIVDAPDRPYPGHEKERGNREQLVDGVPVQTKWFPKIYGKQVGDGSGEIERWLADQRARAERLEPQIK